jgi:hypothetical protein
LPTERLLDQAVKQRIASVVLERRDQHRDRLAWLDRYGSLAEDVPRTGGQRGKHQQRGHPRTEHGAAAQVHVRADPDLARGRQPPERVDQGGSRLEAVAVLRLHARRHQRVENLAITVSFGSTTLVTRPRATPR